MNPDPSHVYAVDCPCDDCRKIFHPTIEERKEMARKTGKVAIRIEIEYEDGRVVHALGDDAFQILQHWNASEIMDWAHGTRYDGPQLKPKPDSLKGADYVMRGDPEP
jgi:hypothetical protein